MKKKKNGQRRFCFVYLLLLGRRSSLFLDERCTFTSSSDSIIDNLLKKIFFHKALKIKKYFSQGLKWLRAGGRTQRKVCVYSCSCVVMTVFQSVVMTVFQSGM